MTKHNVENSGGWSEKTEKGPWRGNLPKKREKDVQKIEVRRMCKGWSSIVKSAV